MIVESQLYLGSSKDVRRWIELNLVFSNVVDSGRFLDNSGVVNVELIGSKIVVDFIVVQVVVIEKVHY